MQLGFKQLYICEHCGEFYATNIDRFEACRTHGFCSLSCEINHEQGNYMDIERVSKEAWEEAKRAGAMHRSDTWYSRNKQFIDDPEDPNLPYQRENMCVNNPERARAIARRRNSHVSFCPICGTRFEGLSIKKYCSRKCKNKAYYVKSQRGT